MWRGPDHSIVFTPPEEKQLAGEGTCPCLQHSHEAVKPNALTLVTRQFETFAKTNGRPHHRGAHRRVCAFVSR